ncbi:hypothetical protein VTK26DRAFT_5051 [Humicola hyalothermophila]
MTAYLIRSEPGQNLSEVLVPIMRPVLMAPGMAIMSAVLRYGFSVGFITRCKSTWASSAMPSSLLTSPASIGTACAFSSLLFLKKGRFAAAKQLNDLVGLEKLWFRWRGNSSPSVITQYLPQRLERAHRVCHGKRGVLDTVSIISISHEVGPPVRVLARLRLAAIRLESRWPFTGKELFGCNKGSPGSSGAGQWRLREVVTRTKRHAKGVPCSVCADNFDDACRLSQCYQPCQGRY